MRNSELLEKFYNAFAKTPLLKSIIEFLEFFQVETFSPEDFVIINDKSYIRYKVQILIETYEKNHYLAYQKNFFTVHLEAISKKEGVSIGYLLRNLKSYQISDFMTLENRLILISEVIRVLSEFDML